MVWKKVDEYRYIAADDGTVGGVAVCEGDRVGITIERAVNTCCEKWRRKSIYTIDELSVVRAGGTVLMHQEPTFCPECAGKL